MSVLTNQSAVNPDRNIWAIATNTKPIVVDAGGNGLVQPFAVNTPFVVAVRTFTAPVAGLLVINATANFNNTAAAVGTFTTRINDTVSGATNQHLSTLPAGNVTAQHESGCPILSLALSANQAVSLQLVLQSTIGNGSPAPTYKWDWSAIFYPA
jgi:hypothetical protein